MKTNNLNFEHFLWNVRKLGVELQNFLGTLVSYKKFWAEVLTLVHLEVDGPFWRSNALWFADSVLKRPNPWME